MKAKALLMVTIAVMHFSGLDCLAFDRCIMCGMDAGKSETKFVIQVSQGTKDIPAGEYAFCCLHCLVLFEHQMGGGKIDSILARDYYNRGEMIDAKKAFYLVESKLHPKGSMVPFMLIFSSEKDATVFEKEFGGNLLGWEEVLKYLESQ